MNIFVNSLKPISGFFVNVSKKLAILSTENNKGLTGQGALVVEGGANIKRNLLVEGNLSVLGSYSSGLSSNINIWEANYNYQVGIVVKRNYTLYVALQTHTSSVFFSDWWVSGYWAAISEPPGSIIMWHNSIKPAGFLECNGSTFTQNSYPELYGILGGETLPDYKGASPAGVGTGSGTYYAVPETIALGQKLDSQVQNHIHTRNEHNTSETFFEQATLGTVPMTGGAGLLQTELYTGGITSPPAVNSTRGKMVGVYFIIKS